MKLYLDLCCLNRPFDDRTQPRVNLEAHAVEAILDAVGTGRHLLCNSAALIVENDQTPKPERRASVTALLNRATEWIPHSNDLDRRVLDLIRFGFRELDAYHLAFAESGSCDRLVTCDDRFLRTARRNVGRIAVDVIDPVSLISEASI